MTHTNDDCFSDTDDTEREMAALRPMRTDLLDTLRALGVCSVCMDYDGYSDEAKIEDIENSPAGITLPKDMEYSLRDFGFRFAHALNPSFDQQHGAFGKLVWDLIADSFAVEHNQYYLEHDTTHYEGL